MALDPTDYRLVQVKWTDAESHYKWADLADAIKETDMFCVSIGWVLLDAPDRLVIASSISLQEDAEMVSGHLTIPKGMVKEIKELTLKGKPRSKKEKHIPFNDTTPSA